MILAILAAGLFSVVPDKSTLKYTVKHKLHEVSAEAHQIEGKAVLRPDGSAQVMVRAPVSAFRSGDGNRDEHMQETMEAVKFQFVTYKGVAKIAPPAAVPATVSVTLDGELEFHGKKGREKVPVTLEFRPGGELHVSGTWTVSLDAYGVERPALLLVPIEDGCVIDLDLLLKEER